MSQKSASNDLQDFALLDFMPDFTEPPAVEPIRKFDEVALGANRVRAFTERDGRTMHILRMRYRFLDPAELRAFTRFCYQQRDDRPFYLPSWQSEIVPVQPWAPGANEIRIALSSLQDLLWRDREDALGRFYFIYDPATELYVGRIHDLTVGSEYATLRTDVRLPFGFNDLTHLVMGWVYLVRFADPPRITAWGPGACEVTMTFKQVIHKHGSFRSTVNGAAVYQSKKFEHVEIIDSNPPILNNLTSYAKGPLALDETQDARFSTTWVAWLSDGGIRLKKSDVYIWLPDNTNGFESELFPDPLDTDHISLAFDQDAREVLAIQYDPDTVELRKVINGEVESFLWPGQDPVLFFNAVALYNEPETDVVAYYIRADEPRKIFARFQRDNFAIEYTVVDDTLRDIVRLVAVEFDETLRVVKIYARISDIYIAIFYTGLYPPLPVPTFDNPRLSLEPFGGILQTMIFPVPFSVEEYGTTIGLEPSGGALVLTAIEYGPFAESINLPCRPDGGNLFTVVLQTETIADAATLGADPDGGRADEVVESVTVDPEAFTVGLAPDGGAIA